MKPNLVEISKIIKPKPSMNMIIPEVKYDYSKIIFNTISLIIIVMGGYILYRRKVNKKMNQIDYQNKVTGLYKEIKIYEKLLKN
jgi:hypothetical protein